MALHPLIGSALCKHRLQEDTFLFTSICMIPKRILDILGTVVGETPQLPPTIVFNEGWMLRLTLDALSRLPTIRHPLGFQTGATWFSEALLPTAFRPRTQADKLSESYTHADGAVGHINVTKSGNAYLTVAKDATQFVVTEAKMFSALSSGVKNAPFFNQAARNVACMAEVLHRAGISPDQFTSIGFYVIAPKIAIEAGVFSPLMTREHVEKTVAERIVGYEGALESWMETAFRPLLARIDLNCISWEELVQAVEAGGDENAADLGAFYKNCLKYNQPRETAPAQSAPTWQQLAPAGGD